MMSTDTTSATSPPPPISMSTTQPNPPTHHPHLSSSPLVLSMRADDVRSSISQPEAGDDMHNLGCEFSPALDMVL